MNGKVAYSTNLPIKDKPEYVILTLGNCPVCYWCHVEDHDYKDGKKFKQENTEFERYSPDKLLLKLIKMSKSLLAAEQIIK